MTNRPAGSGFISETAQAAASAADRARANHTGTQSADTVIDGSTNKAYTATEKTKLAGIATAATANRTDSAVDTLLAAKADLVGGLIPTSQLPSLSLENAIPVASRAAMLALTTTQVQPGDIAVDTSTGSTRGSYILTATDPSNIANWLLLNAPLDAVSSVNGQFGTVVLAAADIGLGNVSNTSDANKPVSTAQAAADGLRTVFRGEWAASTSYAVNDLFTYLGASYIVTTAFTSTTSFAATGTARLSGPRGELAYAETNVNYTLPTTVTAVPGLEIVATAIDRPVMITAHLPYVQNGTASVVTTFSIWDATASSEVQKTIVTFSATTGTAQTIGELAFRMPANAGTKRYQVRALTSATSATLTNAGDVSWINAVEV